METGMKSKPEEEVRMEGGLLWFLRIQSGSSFLGH